MSRRGRKRKIGVRRHRGGKIVQIRQGERERGIKDVVLSQPHRRGIDDQMLGCCVGRMIYQCWDEWGAADCPAHIRAEIEAEKTAA